MSDGPRQQDGLPVESTEARCSGKFPVIDDDINSLQLEHDGVLVVRYHVSAVGSKTVHGDVVRVPTVKISEGRIIHDPAIRDRLLEALGLGDEDGASGGPQDDLGFEGVNAQPEPEEAVAPAADGENYSLFDNEDTQPADVPERPYGQLEVRDADAAEDTLGGVRVGRVRQSSDARLAAFLNEDDRDRRRAR